MQFLGREKELKILNEQYESESGFVVIYGRRRIGKTTLIKEFIKDKSALYYLATVEMEQAAINRFAQTVGEFVGKPHLGNAVFRDWRDLFREIVSYNPDAKKVIVIDELPYLVKINRVFPSILQYIWDEMLKDTKNIMLILCGSLISMMEKYTLYHNSPLYGRRTAQIRLTPLPFKTVSRDVNFETDAEQFAITGGVPKYLEFFDGKNTKQVIDDVILSKSGFLYDEPVFLLKEEVKEPVTYFSIIEAIAKGNHKIGKIASVLEVPTTRLTPYLSTLIDLCFVEKQLPITEMNEEKSKKGLYFISDNFVRFWFKYIYPYKGQLELDQKQIVMEKLESDFVSNFVAFAYEDICREIFLDLALSGKIDISPSRLGSYWSNDGDIQIDVAVLDNYHKKIFFGECKYHNKPVDIDVYFDLRNKVKNSKEIQAAFNGYDFMYGVFSKSSFTERLSEIAKENNSLYLIDRTELVL